MPHHRQRHLPLHGSGAVEEEVEEEVEETQERLEVAVVDAAEVEVEVEEDLHRTQATKIQHLAHLLHPGVCPTEAPSVAV
jgi:hypothetical protein